MEDHKLLEYASLLQAKSNHILNDLNLENLVQVAGYPVRIGSWAGNVMTHRDIDLGVLCQYLTSGPVFKIAHEVFDHPRVRRVQVTDERPPYQSMDGPENEGIYCGIRYMEDGRSDLEWKIDLWFFPEAAPRPEVMMRDRLLGATSGERLTILRMKHELQAQDLYGKTVYGIDVYRAVLDEGETEVTCLIEGR